MRKTTLAATTSALAAVALLAGAGTAAAQNTEEPKQVCVAIETFGGAMRAMCLTPQVLDSLGSIGYGSVGTGSLADLLTGAINTGSTALSVDLPNLTGSYAPGSMGSYGPEASVGQVLTGSLGNVAGAS